MDERATDRTPDTGQAAGAEGMLSARDAGAVLGVHERTVRRAIARGELPAVKVGGVFRIAREDLERYRAPGRITTPPVARRPERPRLLPFPVRDEAADHAFPWPPTPLIGRNEDVAAIGRLLQTGGKRHVTLTGTGGVGKTRLAIQAAAEHERAFPDGVWFVPLAPVRDPALFGTTIVRTMGVVEQNDRPAVRTLKSVIRDRRLLLVLDSLEHLLAETPVIAELLAACPNLVILATSRIRLNLSGEHEHHVLPLALPRSSADTTPSPWVEIVGGSAAVKLFVARAQAVDSAFRLTAENASAVAAISAAVDGLPLAIELVAAQTRLFPPAALLARMGRRLPLLTGGPRDYPKRHQTMTDAIAWSHDLLTVDEQTLFRRLSVFVDGFTLDAAEAITGLDSPSSVIGMIASLADHQLLSRIDQPHGNPRFTMLEMIREFANERLAESGEGDECHRRHASFFLAFAERYQLAEMLPDGEEIVAMLDTERANLRAALSWLDDEPSEPELFLRLAAAMGIYWSGQGHYQEGRRWLERALAHGSDGEAVDRASALVRLGLIEAYQAANQHAENHLTEGLALAREAGNAHHTTHALLGLGALAIQQGDHDRGEELLEESLAAAQGVTDQRLAGLLAGQVLVNLSAPPRARWDHALAAERLEAALRRLREAGGSISSEILALGDLGDLARDRGEHARALGLYHEALRLVRGNPGTRVVTDVIEAVGVVATAVGQAERGARLLGAAGARRERMGLRYRVVENEVALERAVAAARAALGEVAFATAWAAGRNLRPEEAVAEALAPFPISAASPAASLTPREMEILRLLAAGMTDPRIAETLFISVRTVQNHVAHILAKLGVRSRTAAGLAAGLVPPESGSPG